MQRKVVEFFFLDKFSFQVTFEVGTKKPFDRRMNFWNTSENPSCIRKYDASNGEPMTRRDEMMNDQGHILVVDDSPRNRLKLSRFLQQQGHTVTGAENGRQALAMLTEQVFNLMLHRY